MPSRNSESDVFICSCYHGDVGIASYIAMEKRKVGSSCFTAQEVRDLEFVYRTFDVNGRDILEGEEVRKALRLLTFKVSRKTVQHLLQDLQVWDSPSSTSRQRNTANFEGFLEIVAKLQGSSYDQHEEIVQVNSVLFSVPNYLQCLAN